jgi:protein involved in polysaccharide export with SLBB domain
MTRHLMLAVGFTLAAAAVHAQSSSPGTAAAPELRPGDAVRVQVWQRQDLSGQFAVDGQGRIAHPILKDVTVTGVPFDQATLRLAQLLRTFHGEVQFVVEPLVRVGVAGEVRQPNLYHLPPDMTLAYAVAAAGGATERGRLDRVEFVRNGVRRVVDLTDPGDLVVNTELRSGDQVLVGRRRDVLREYVMPLSSVVGALAALIRISR